MEKTIHQGCNLKRFREMLNIKQDGLAWDLGEGWSQKRVSLLEQREKIDPTTLEKVAAIMKIPVEAFQNFDEQQAVSIIANTFTTVNDNATGQLFQIKRTINILEKRLEHWRRLRG